MAVTHAEAVRYGVELALRGYAVHPVNLTITDEGKKTFAEKWSQSSKNPDEVRELFRKRPDANGVIVDCGKSGIVAIDVDNGPGKSGYDNLKEAGIELPETPVTVRTLTGGEHRYYRQPFVTVGTDQGRPVRDVDIRGKGGMVFAPPTCGSYTFQGPVVAVSELPVLPDSFVRYIEQSKTPSSPMVTKVLTTEATEEQQRQYQQWMDRDLGLLRDLQEGQRHMNALGPIRRFIDRGLKLKRDPDELTKEVLDAYRASGGMDEEDILRIISDAHRWAKESPLSAFHDDGFDADVKERTYKLRVDAEAKRRARQHEAPSFLSVAQSVPLGKPPPPEKDQVWVEGLIRKGETNYLFGRQFTGKSFIAVDVAMSMATGQQWVGGTQTTPGKVLYLAGEDTQGLQARTYHWTQDRKVPFPLDRIQVWNAVPHLESEKAVLEVAELVRDQEIDLIVVDTLKRAIDGIGWNESGRLQTVSNNLDKLRSLRPGAAVLVLAHPTIEGELPGGAALAADVFAITRVVSDDQGDISLANLKWKNGTPPRWTANFRVESPGVLRATAPFHG